MDVAAEVTAAGICSETTCADAARVSDLGLGQAGVVCSPLRCLPTAKIIARDDIKSNYKYKCQNI